MDSPLIKKFLGNTPRLAQLLKEKPETYWISRGEQQTLALFHQMAARVPAYKDFLKKSRIKASSIKTIKDFKQLPLTNKENYLQSYPLEKLAWDGKFKENRWTISSTSGSTGEPFYFPRTKNQELQFQLTAELCLREYFKIHRYSTLFIDCFALGVWIGGMFMYQAIKNLINTNRYQLSMITPGADKVETLKAVRKLAHHFDQIIIGGYGPLVKDLVDDGIAQGINWNDFTVKYFFAAESFTEKFRDYIAKHGGAQNIYTDLINHYGTADLGTMAHETSVTIITRRNGIFDQNHQTPTVCQFVPELFFFEAIDTAIACSGLGGLPLMRYNLKDRGGVTTLSELGKIFEQRNIDLPKNLWNLPLVYFYERADFTVSIYSVNIYPESIRRAFETAALRKVLSSKFSMRVDFDKKQNQFLEINIELRPHTTVTARLREQALAAIIASLNRENSEWRDFYVNPGIRHKVTPHLVFWPYQDPTYFRPGGKQKWIKK